MRRAAADRLFGPYNERGLELSLVLFTLIAQAVAGAIVYLFIFGTPQTFRLQFTLLVLFLLAQAFSFLHLGRKGNAFGSVRGLGHSWLSAEIAALGLLAALLGGVTLLTLLDGVPPWLLRLGLGVEVLGAVLVIYCMINCYLLPARPLWNTPLTPVSFLASANLLGLNLYLVLTGGAYTATHMINVTGTLLVLLAVHSATLRRFGFWPALMQPVSDWRDVRALYVLRIVLAAMALIAMIAGAGPGPMFVLVALGEFLGRILFYKLSPATREFGALYV